MSEEFVAPLDEFDAPYGRKIRIEAVTYESGLRLLRMRIREGSRFTVMDLDETTTRRLLATLTTWADQAQGT
jgi:hypothetical protein